jgi:alpha-L-fucosidase 2
MGWKVNLWAKLLDGNHAYKLIKDQLSLVEKDGWGEKGGTYANLFDAHPPFQIDGNFGCTSGITEMLLQTQNGSIDILPALPDEWKNGKITGLRTYGGFEVNLVWEDSQIKKITIKSNLGGNCRIRVPNEVELLGKLKLKNAKGDNPNPFFEIPKIKNLSFLLKLS